MQSFCKNLSISVVLVAGHMVQVSGQQPTPASGRIDFSRDIRPILSDKCFVCHGPDAVEQQKQTALRHRSPRFADLGNGRRAIVRGHPEQSELVRRITAENAAMRMPPVYSGRKLTKQEIERLTRMDRSGRAVATALGIHRAGSGRRRRK